MHIVLHDKQQTRLSNTSPARQSVIWLIRSLFDTSIVSRHYDKSLTSHGLVRVDKDKSAIYSNQNLKVFNLRYSDTFHAFSYIQSVTFQGWHHLNVKGGTSSTEKSNISKNHQKEKKRKKEKKSMTKVVAQGQNN